MVKPNDITQGNKLVTLLLVFVCFVSALHAQQPFHISTGVASSHNVSFLEWTTADGVGDYQVWRQYPNELFEFVAIVSGQTSYHDSLTRTICSDTVNYYVVGNNGIEDVFSDTVGIYHTDDIPTAPCQLKVCSVDTAADRIFLSWYPSPDADVMGYFIVQGNPSRGYDTVWGRENTTYLCRENLAEDLAEAQYDFRIMAFDSCYQASALTPYYHNPVLQFTQEPCSRHFRCKWNRYINMPDSVAHYTLFYQLENSDVIHRLQVGPEGPFEFDTVISDLAVGRVNVYLRVDNSTDSLHAFSLCRTFQFPSIDTAEYLTIASADYYDTIPAIMLDIDVDPSFAGSPVQIYRRRGSREQFAPIAEIEINPYNSHIQYLDRDIYADADFYTYQLSVHDSCEYYTQYSDTLQIVLPTVSTGLFIPNILISGSAELGRFCPQLLSPLAKGYHFAVFNRYGERVFYTTDINDCWDGTSADGHVLPQGTYVYLISCSHSDGSDKKYKGTITLIK